jgi:uncharacterized protein (TIGR02996 family)
MSDYLSSQPQVLALLREARERPEDDGPRLVLADWLDEHGDPDRAEFIRLQVRCAPGSVLDADQRSRLQHRVRELLDRHGGAWLGPLWRFWLSPVNWHRGLLSVGLTKRMTPSSITDALSWIDTGLFQVSGRRSLEHVAEVLTLSNMNHVYLDLRQPLRESKLLDLLALWPEDRCLRTLSWDWPLSLLHRHEEGQEQPVTVPAVSEPFLTRLLSELPVGRHLTHLASLPSWSAAQANLIRSLGIEPSSAHPKLWMHARSASCFRARSSTAPSNP